MLVKANLHLVVSVAKQYQSQMFTSTYLINEGSMRLETLCLCISLSLGDLINGGSMGLTKTAQQFGKIKGFKFASYAVWWMWQSILKALAQHACIARLPLSVVDAFNRISSAYSILEQCLKRTSSAKKFYIIKMSDRHVSLVEEKEESNLLDIVEEKTEKRADQYLIIESLRKEITRALDTLSKKESDVVKDYFGLNNQASLTLQEIGTKLGLTRERIRQIKEKAICKLQHIFLSKILKSYLGYEYS